MSCLTIFSKKLIYCFSSSFFLTRNFPAFEVNRAYLLYNMRLSLQTHRMNKCKQPLRNKTNDKLMTLAYVCFGTNSMQV